MSLFRNMKDKEALMPLTDSTSEAKPKKAAKPKHKNPVVRAFTGVWKFLTLIKTFSGKLLWYSSCGKCHDD